MNLVRLQASACATLLGLVLAHSADASTIVTFGTGGNQFHMEFVPIGSPGNAGDMTGNANPSGAGAVG